MAVRPNKFFGRESSLAFKLNCYSMADSDNPLSIALAAGMVSRMIGTQRWKPSRSGDKTGHQFEEAVGAFVLAALKAAYAPASSPFHVLVPIQRGAPDKRKPTEGPPTIQSSIANFEAYSHLMLIADIAAGDPELRVLFGGDYLVRPDVVVWREPTPASAFPWLEADDVKHARSPLLEEAGAGNVLHASISCKWTMRSDRAQNTRTEALNLIRNRKGRVPHIVAITMEPLPSRIASIAQGTGDIDCTYHCALRELASAAEELSNQGNKGASREAEVLRTLIDGRRLRDVADLPLDLLL